VALAVLLAAAPAAARTVRVFAVQPKLDLAWMQSRQTFHDKMFGLADRRLRGPGRPPIQSGADDFASHLRGHRDLVVWPDGTSAPVASDLNFVAGQAVPNLVIVKLSAGGKIDIRNDFGSTSVIVDVVGWYN